MFVLVYAPQGIVGEYGSSARVYDSYLEAHEVMSKEASYDSEHEDRVECAIDEWHATNDCSDPCAAEWHIYEA